MGVEGTHPLPKAGGDGERPDPVTATGEQKRLGAHQHGLAAEPNAEPEVETRHRRIAIRGVNPADGGAGEELGPILCLGQGRASRHGDHRHHRLREVGVTQPALLPARLVAHAPDIGRHRLNLLVGEA